MVSRIKRVLALSSLLLIGHALADGNPSPLTVSIDRNSIGMDESLALTLSVRTDGASQVGEVQFSAPDFDEVNQYSSVFVESYYQNGRFGVRNNKRVTKILKPRRTGQLQISGIKVLVAGKSYDHPPVTVDVFGAGQGTPPPPRYGGSGMGLRGIGKNVPSTPFTIRVELDRNRIYKGQQLIVSYYLYRRARVFNIQVEKYPILDGFLREDLDLPILGQRLESESVVLDGVAYERSLLARYAAYPLKEGRLAIDSMSIKGNYYPGSSADLDPGNPLQSFFQQLQPREWSHRSDRGEVEVFPLPTEGRPTSFTGGVGEFTLEGSVDRSIVKANEAVTFNYKVLGSGNIAALTEPKVRWPQDVEVYETKSRTNPAKSGTPSKTFEILVIPRKPGKMVIPAAEMSYFSVKEKGYKTTNSQPIEIEVMVGGGIASQPASPRMGSRASPSQSSPSAEPLRFFSPEEWRVSSVSALVSKAGWRVVLAMLSITCLLLVGVALRKFTRLMGRISSIRSAKRSDEEGRSFQKLREFSANRVARATWPEVVAAYEELAQKLCIRVEELSGIPARAIGREELLRQGMDAGKTEEGIWKRVVLVLEYSEWVRFGSGAGVVSESEARSRLGDWISEADRLSAEIKKGSS